MKLGMRVHHHDLECHTERFGCYLYHDEGHSACSNPKKITVSSISPELLNLKVHRKLKGQMLHCEFQCVHDCVCCQCVCKL